MSWSRESSIMAAVKENPIVSCPAAITVIERSISSCLFNAVDFITTSSSPLLADNILGFCSAAARFAAISSSIVCLMAETAWMISLIRSRGMQAISYSGKSSARIGPV